MFETMIGNTKKASKGKLGKAILPDSFLTMSLILASPIIVRYAIRLNEQSRPLLLSFLSLAIMLLSTFYLLLILRRTPRPERARYVRLSGMTLFLSYLGFISLYCVAVLLWEQDRSYPVNEGAFIFIVPVHSFAVLLLTLHSSRFVRRDALISVRATLSFLFVLFAMASMAYVYIMGAT